MSFGLIRLSVLFVVVFVVVLMKLESLSQRFRFNLLENTVLVNKVVFSIRILND